MCTDVQVSRVTSKIDLPFKVAISVPTGTRLAEVSVPGLGGVIHNLSRRIHRRKGSGRSFDRTSTRILKHSGTLAWGFPG